MSVQVKQEAVGAIYLFCVKKYKEALAPAPLWPGRTLPVDQPPPPAPAGHTSQLTAYFLGVGRQ